MAIRFRPATLEDVPSIEALECASFANATETFNRRQIRGLITNPRAVVTVAAMDEQVVGWAVGLLRVAGSPGISRRQDLARDELTQPAPDEPGADSLDENRSPVLRPGMASGRLYSVAVDPAHRSQGLGRRLTIAILDSLTQQGAQRLYLEVRADNANAIALYRSLGFVAHAPLPDYYAPGVAALRMRRDRDDAQA